MTLAAGTRLGPYEISGLLGQGGMGEVYRARDPRLRREVAIKVLPAELASDPDRMHRFEREARAASALNHPGILTVFDFGAHEGRPYLVTELLEGETLRSRLSQGPLPLSRACDFASQIAEGLAAAHERGIVHRDLKPENIFITGNGRLKLLDFGLARLLEVPGDDRTRTASEMTAAGTVLGTVGYMSPEQVRGEHGGAASDVFSFGAVLYEMLTAERAFRGGSAVETLSAILRDEPEPLAVRRPEAPAALGRLLDRCLAKRPEERFVSGRELLFALEVASAVPQSSAGGSGAAILPPGATAIPRRARRWATWLAIGLAGALAGAAAVSLVSRRPVAPAMPLLASLEAPEEALGLLWARGGADLALSPDGRRVAFAAAALGRQPALWIRALDSPAGGELAGTADGKMPFWSPDGRTLGFFAEGKLKRFPIDGGPVQTLCDAPMAFGAFWHPDGTIVFADHPALYRIPAAGGTPEPIAEPGPGELSIRFPELLADGRHFLYLAHPERGRHRIYVGSLVGQEAPRLLFENDTRAIVASPSHLLFVRDGVLLAQSFDEKSLTLRGDARSLVSRVANNPLNGNSSIAVSRTGVLAFAEGSDLLTELVWLDRDGKTVGQGGDLAAYIGPTLSSDGRRVTTEIANEETGQHETWILDLARGVRARFTRPPEDGHYPVLSPDGRQIAFISSPTGTNVVYVQRADGLGEKRPLFSEESGSGSVRGWSPDGDFVLISTYSQEGASRLWLLPIREGEKARPLVAGVNGAISPDGKWLATASNESGRYQIYVLTYPALNTRWQVSVEGGHEPRWRQDGKELFYISDDRRLMSVQIRTGDPFDAAPPRALFPLRVVSTFEFTPHHYDVAPDGTRFLVSQLPQHARTPAIRILLNWEAALAQP